MTNMLGKYNIERLLDALGMQESGGNNAAVSPAGARGVYQFMRPTWEDPGYGVPARAGGTWEAFLNDTTLQREQARRYLKAMYDRTGSVPAALAAYNGGLKRGLAYKAGQPVPEETRKYVPGVLGRYLKGQSLPGSTPGDGTLPPVADTRSPARIRFDQAVGLASPVTPAVAAPTDADMPGLSDMMARAPDAATAQQAIPPSPESPLYNTLTPEQAGPKVQDRLPPVPSMAPEAMPAPTPEQDPAGAMPGIADLGGPDTPFAREGIATVDPEMPGPPMTDPNRVGPAGDFGNDPYADRLGAMADFYNKEPSFGDNLRTAAGDTLQHVGAGLMSHGLRQQVSVDPEGERARNEALAMKRAEAGMQSELIGDQYQALLGMNYSPQEAFILAASGEAGNVLADRYGGNSQFGTVTYLRAPNGEIFTQQPTKTGAPATFDTMGNPVTDPERLRGARPVAPPRLVETDAGVFNPYEMTPDEAATAKTRATAGQDLGKEEQWYGETMSSLDYLLRPENKKGLDDLIGVGGGTDFGRNIRSWTGGQDARDAYSHVEKLLSVDYIKGFQSVKGAGPVSEKEGLAGANAQSRLRSALGTDPKKAREAMMEMQYLNAHRLAKAYVAAGQPVPESVRQSLAVARRNVPRLASWMEGNATVQDYTSQVGPKVASDAEVGTWLTPIDVNQGTGSNIRER